MATAQPRPSIEVADILRLYGEEYRCTHNPSEKQRAVMRHILSCRTASLGGHKDTCDTCGHVRHSYNSCRDRHCPKCQNLKKAEWLEGRRKRLLPTNYFHVVFTLPSQLRPFALQNKRLLYDLLFRTAAETIQTLAKDKKRLGAQVGFTAILHSWTQSLLMHPHLHCVVTGGGLSEEGSRWVKGSADYFLPKAVMGAMFRGKFLFALKQAYEAGRLRLHGSLEKYRSRSAWKKLLNRLYDLKWVVYAKRPFGGAEQVFRYLGRYTHRVAISNHRLVELKEGQVYFQVRDRKAEGKKKTIHLDALEFVRRFLLHVLPGQFTRIRHYGLLAGRNIKTKFARACELLREMGQEAPAPMDEGEKEESPLPWWERLLQLTGIDVMACPVCGEGRFRLEALPASGMAVANHSPP
ncbi:MAG: IS91 family transposase [Thermodesulfobacteriota bacterium]|nr:IS91 family transposase [Thermodesulfobacteriota bacterium]